MIILISEIEAAANARNTFPATLCILIYVCNTIVEIGQKF